MTLKLYPALLISALLCGAVVADPPPTMPLPYQTSFSVMDRPPAMPDQLIDGWTGWRVPRGHAAINPLAGPNSAAAIELQPETILRRPIEASEFDEVWTRTVVYTTGSPASTEGLPTRPLGAVLLFDNVRGMMALDGDGAGEGNLIILGLSSTPKWRTVVIRHDFVAQRWDLWVDGLVWGHGFGFRDYVPHFSGLDVGAAESSSLVSQVRISATPPTGISFLLGDVRINGVVNAGDIVRLVNYLEGGDPLSNASFVNADIDHNNTVDEVDLDLLVNLILGVEP